MKYLFLFFLFFILAPAVLANDNNQFITIVNPVRISSYNPDPLSSLKSQYYLVTSYSLPATWLLTYDVLNHGDMVNFFKTYTKNQELGVFLEVTPGLAAASKVEYQNSGSWHFANSVFLSGYTQADRIKLIDTVFAKFKHEFGYFPVSVGSWWTDSYSLAYLENNYHVTGNLTVADQFSTDGYQVWGQYWSTPFYPSRYHAGVPASTPETKLNLVNLQWAARDPLQGYSNSLYSTQDYATLGLNTDYFKKLLSLYAGRHDDKFGQITVGLEGDLPADVYSKEFIAQLKYLGSIEVKTNYSLTTMATFAKWYKDSFPDFSPPRLITSPDLLGSTTQAIWYQSPKFRLGLIHDSKTNILTIRDLRLYSPIQLEPYYVSPNTSPKLSINILSPLDEEANAGEKWQLSAGAQISYETDGFTISPSQSNIPLAVKKYPLLRIENTNKSTRVVISQTWISPLFGQIKQAYSSQAIHFFHQKKFPLQLLMGQGWNYFHTQPYLISPGEIEALIKLSTLPPGRVITPDSECLQCIYHTANRPLIFSNQREYVSQISLKPLVKNSTIISTDVSKAKQAFKQSRAKYIYLSRVEQYSETPSFSPGDLGVEKVFENANAQIWQVVK